MPYGLQLTSQSDPFVRVVGLGGAVVQDDVDTPVSRRCDPGVAVLGAQRARHSRRCGRGRRCRHRHRADRGNLSGDGQIRHGSGRSAGNFRDQTAGPGRHRARPGRHRLSQRMRVLRHGGRPGAGADAAVLITAKSPRTLWITRCLLADQAPAVQGDQIAGCGEQEARLAVVALAGLHGPSWRDPAYLDFPAIAFRTPGRSFRQGSGRSGEDERRHHAGEARRPNEC